MEQPSSVPEVKGPPAAKTPPEPAPAAASKPAAAAPSDKKTQESPKASASPTPAAPLPLPAPLGTVARITGIVKQPELNGELGQLLKQADNAADRVVVRTRFGEKSLKHSNLQVGFFVVVPKLVLAAASILLVFSSIVAVELLRTRGRSAIGAAGAPAAALAWLLVTIGACIWLYRPCRPKDTWFPSLGAVGEPKPARSLFRSGFLVTALLLGATAWLYGELLMPRLADVPLMPANRTKPAPNATEVEEPVNSDVSGHAMATDEDEATNPPAASEATPESAGAVNTSAPDMGNLLVERSVLYGYGAAVALAAQGLFVFEGKKNLQSLCHVVGAIGFAVAANQHCMQSLMLLGGPKGQPIAEARAAVFSSPRMDVQWLRAQIVQLGPMVLLGLPLLSQMFNKMSAGATGQPQGVKAALQQSGLLTSLRSIQWGALLFYAVFVGSYMCDFWAVAGLP